MSNARVDQAVDKLRDEMAANANNPALAVIGEELTDRLRRNPLLAEKILVEGKTLKGALNKLINYAHDHMIRDWSVGRPDRVMTGNSCGVVPPDKAQEIILAYYGLEDVSSGPERTAARDDGLDLDALLGL